MAKKGKPKKAGVTRVSIFWLGLLVLAVLYIPTTIILLVGLLPSFVAFIVDSRREKYVATSVAILNICGTLPFIFDLWAGGQTIPEAVKIITSPWSWLAMYGAAALGWMLTRAMPPFVALTLNVGRDERIRRLKKRQNHLLENWGNQIAQVNRQIEDDDDDDEEDSKKASKSA